MYDSEVMSRKEGDTPWSIYRDFTVVEKRFANLVIDWEPANS